MSVWHGINCPFCGQLHAGLPCPLVKGSREVWYPVHKPIPGPLENPGAFDDIRAALAAAEKRAEAITAERDRLRDALERIVSKECEYRSETARSIARAALEGEP